MLIPLKYFINFQIPIKGIIHVGAHELEEMKDYLKRGIDKIIWIEANPAKYRTIEKKIINYKNMYLGKFAASSKEGSVKLNIANNGQSSSILEFGTHKKSYPKIEYTSKIDVRERRVDNWIQENIKNKNLFNFINIDVQGYELEALKGMKKQLKYVDYLYLEVNFRQVYKNCSELNEVDEFLKKYNFQRVAIYRTNKGWGDAIYKKKYIFVSKLYYLLIIPLVRIMNIPKKIFKKSYYYLKSSLKKI